MAFSFNNLPGLQVNTIDGGLAAINTPSTKSVLVLGTSAIGPANAPFQVVSMSTASSLFGGAGTLVQAMAEVGNYCDNIFMYRMGTTPGTFLVGKQISGSPTLGPSNAITSGTSSGGVITFVLSAGPTADIIPGASINVSGFAVETAFNATFTVISVNTSTHHIVVDLLGNPDGTETHAAIAQSTTPVISMPGFLVQLGEIAATANTDYSVWYNTGVLYLWLNGNLVYANDVSNDVVVNTGDSVVTGSTTGGLTVGTSTASLANAITISAAAVLSGSSTNPTPVYVAPITGLGMSARATYTAQQDALDLLEGFPVDFVVTPNAILDNPNIAYYVSSDSTTAANNPATNANALDWLLTTVDAFGNKTYHWAGDSVDSKGNSVAPTTFSVPSTRIAANYHEVSFGYQLARFCAAQSEAPQATNAGTIGFIGTSGPASLSNFSLSAVRSWIGFLPTYNPITGNPSVPGAGLLGIPYLTGTTAGKLHSATSDVGNGFRLPGFFATSTGEYDGGAQIDTNGFKVDIGAYIAVQGDYVLQSNSFGQYVGNIANIVAGKVSALDQLNAATNKPIAGIQQLYRASLNQLDALTFADINVMKYQGAGNLPTSLHDKTAANSASDYILLMRQRIKFLVVQTVLKVANPFIGNGTNDGLQVVAMKTALDTAFLNLQKRGYIGTYTYTITSTLAQQRIGQASIAVNFSPADELIQLLATVSLQPN